MYHIDKCLFSSDTCSSHDSEFSTPQSFPSCAPSQQISSSLFLMLSRGAMTYRFPFFSNLILYCQFSLFITWASSSIAVSMSFLLCKSAPTSSLYCFRPPFMLTLRYLRSALSSYSELFFVSISFSLPFHSTILMYVLHFISRALSFPTYYSLLFFTSTNFTYSVNRTLFCPLPWLLLTSIPVTFTLHYIRFHALLFLLIILSMPFLLIHAHSLDTSSYFLLQDRFATSFL